MIQIVEVKTKKQIKTFIDFPNKLYKGVDQYVPPLFSDEMKTFNPKKFSYRDVVESVHYLAYKDDKVVGRIEGFIQKQSNEKNNEKRIRFTRFDAIDDEEVAKALFDAIEKWGKAKGMDTLCGPLGYSDLEREGLLIEGFDQLSTFEEQYNYDYYPKLVESVGLTKEVDWLEWKITKPEKPNTSLRRIADRMLKECGLTYVDPNKFSKSAYINRYKDGFFKVLDKCYSHLYGTVDLFGNEDVKKSLVDQFNMILNKNLIVFIVDKNDQVVAASVCFPSLSRPFQKSGGRITIPSLFKLAKAVKKPKIIDLGLVAVLPEYQQYGINAVFLAGMYDLLDKGGVEWMETNLNLETNTQVMAQWKRFTAVNHKRRRAYIKKI